MFFWFADIDNNTYKCSSKTNYNKLSKCNGHVIGDGAQHCS